MKLFDWRLRRVGLGLALCCGLLGCYTTPLEAGGPGVAKRVEVTRHPGAWGETGIGDKKVCPLGMQSVLISEPWYGNLLRLVTLGLVASYRVHIVCSEGTTHS